MKYNIVTTLNSDYMPFGILFIGSLFDNVDFDSINKIYIFDTGLRPLDLNYLKLFPKVEVEETTHKTQNVKMHDEQWQKNVYSKTSFLLQVIKKDKLPTIMIDSDCIFVSDFFDLLDDSKDFILCERARAGFSKYIGSFFVAHNVKKAEEFISDWIGEIKKGTEKHKETPALSRVAEKYENIGILPEQQVSYFSFDGQMPTRDARIIHLKSDAGRETIEKRIHQPHTVEYVRRYFS